VTLAIVIFGVFVLGLGVLGLVRPRTLMAIVERPWRTGLGLPLAVVFRTALGILLLGAASETRFPTAVGAVGALSLLSAGTALFVGRERARRFVDWWLAKPDSFVRGGSLLACAFGAFLIYAAT
jgi:hypothetical protein